MLDLMQLEADEVYGNGKKYGMPALLHTQLLGLSMGMNTEEVGLSLNKVNAEKILEFLSE